MVILEFIVGGVCLTSVGLVWAVYQLLLHNGKLQLGLERLEKRLYAQGVLSQDAEPVSTGLPVGSVLHDFELPALSGGTRTLSSWRGRRLLLIFFNPSCNFCREMLPDLALVPSREEADPFIVIVSNGDEAQNRELFAVHNIVHPVLLQKDTEVSSLYWINATPSGYLVDQNGMTASVLYTGAAALLGEVRGNGNRTLLPQAATANRGSSRSLEGSRILRDGLKAGARAPDFRLDLAGGGEITLQSYLGRRVLLVFSDPNCGPCNSLLPRLQNLEPSLNIEIIMISRGGNEANRRHIAEYDITFPVALQKNWEISRAYGIFATPVAFWIGEDGLLAADVAVGAEAILKMASKAGRGVKRQRRLAAIERA